MRILGSDEIPGEDDHVRWAAVEIEDFLRAGQVGLYEVVDSLRGRYSVKADSEYLPDARRVLHLLLALNAGVLRRVMWASEQTGSLLAAGDLTDAWFDAPSDENMGEYVVLEPHHARKTARQPDQNVRPDGRADADEDRA